MCTISSNDIVHLVFYAMHKHNVSILCLSVESVYHMIWSGSKSIGVYLISVVSVLRLKKKKVT